MAEHIKNVLEREYVSKAQGSQELVPTTLGIALVDGEERRLLLPLLCPCLTLALPFLWYGLRARSDALSW